MQRLRDNIGGQHKLLLDLKGRQREALARVLESEERLIELATLREKGGNASEIDGEAQVVMERHAAAWMDWGLAMMDDMGHKIVPEYRAMLEALKNRPPEDDESCAHLPPIRPIMMLPPLSWSTPKEAPPSLPESPVRFQVNLIPGGPRHAAKGPVRNQPGMYSDEDMHALKTAVGDDGWPAFQRMHDDFIRSLRPAERHIEMIYDAVNEDDFSRFRGRTVAALKAVDDRFSQIQPVFASAGVTLSSAVLAYWNDLKAEFARLESKGPPKTVTEMSVTGEYER